MLSMYDVSIPVLMRTMTNLRSVMNKAKEHAVAHEIDPAALIEFRMYPDMLPLRWQIYIATDTAKFAAKRLAEVEAPTFDDKEATFEELDARLEKTIEFLKSVPREKMEGTESKEVVMKRRGGEWTFDGRTYLLGFVIPQVYFHVTTAYVILRHNGVKLGKMDYIGPPPA